MLKLQSNYEEHDDDGFSAYGQVTPRDYTSRHGDGDDDDDGDGDDIASESPYGQVTPNSEYLSVGMHGDAGSEVSSRSGSTGTTGTLTHKIRPSEMFVDKSTGRKASNEAAPSSPLPKGKSKRFSVYEYDTIIKDDSGDKDKEINYDNPEVHSDDEGAYVQPNNKDGTYVRHTRKATLRRSDGSNDNYGDASQFVMENGYGRASGQFKESDYSDPTKFADADYSDPLQFAKGPAYSEPTQIGGNGKSGPSAYSEPTQIGKSGLSPYAPTKVPGAKDKSPYEPTTVYGAVSRKESPYEPTVISEAPSSPKVSRAAPKKNSEESAYGQVAPPGKKKSEESAYGQPVLSYEIGHMDDDNELYNMLSSATSAKKNGGGFLSSFKKKGSEDKANNAGGGGNSRPTMNPPSSSSIGKNDSLKGDKQVKKLMAEKVVQKLNAKVSCVNECVCVCVCVCVCFQKINIFL